MQPTCEISKIVRAFMESISILGALEGAFIEFFIIIIYNNNYYYYLVIFHKSTHR